MSGVAKDWTGNTKSIYATHGASSHSETERQENDYYATEPKAVQKLLDKEKFSKTIWECACGGGHISEVLSKNGYDVFSTDKYFYNYEGQGLPPVDFLEENEITGLDNFDIITNPPYKYAKEFCETAIERIGDGHKVAMFLKLTFLEGKARREFFRKYPPKKIYVFSSRVNCAKNGDFTNSQSAVCYAWFIWEKNFNGLPEIDWID